MKRLVVAGCVFCAGMALAMPTRKDLAKAQEMVNDVTASDVKALKAGTKKPAEVAATHMDLAAKAGSEAEKYLLLQGAFNLYAKAGDFDAAADALETMVKDIPDMRPDVIVEIYNKAIFRSMKDKAPRLYAIKEAARKAAANRKRLPELEKAAKAKPQDTKAQKALGECHAELGNWDKAIAAFTKADGELAKTAKAELDGTLKPQELADFWWDYNEDANAYRLHAVTFYRDALADDGFQGLARERAERRIKEMEADHAAAIEGLAAAGKTAVAVAAASSAYKGGESIDLVLDRKKNIVLNMSICPPGSFKCLKGENINHKTHKVTITYPFAIMKSRLTYGRLKALVPSAYEACRKRLNPDNARLIPDDVPAVEISGRELEVCLQKLNAIAARDEQLRAFRGYEFRIPTLAEHDYAFDAGGTVDRMGRIKLDERVQVWQDMGYPKQGNRYAYPGVPESYVLKNKGVNAWGVYWHCETPEPVADKIPQPLDKSGRCSYMLLSAVNDVFGYEDEEVNPLRWYTGKDATGISRSPWVMCGGLGDSNGNLRFVFAPKLSALNVYPRTAKDGPIKAHNGAVIAPVKTDGAAATAKTGDAVSAKPLSFELAKGMNLEFVHCPAGTFKMSNAPGGPNGEGTHEVKLTRAYWIATTRVTRELYKTFEADYDKDEKAKGEKKPGDFVTGRARAEAFAGWLNKRFGAKLPRGYVFRLPSEAEWEYAMNTGTVDRNYDFEGTLDMVRALSNKANAWKFDTSVMDYAASEIDPVRMCEQNPAWVCRQNNQKRFLLRPDGSGSFRMVVGPDLLAEKKK